MCICQVQHIDKQHPAARVRMIYCQEALHTLPSSLRSLFQRQAPFSRPLIASLLHDLKVPAKKCTDESVYSFFERRIGPDVAAFAVAPLIRGVCAGDAHKISVKMLFRALFEAEQNHSSIIRGMLLNSLKNITHPKKTSITLGKLAQKSRTEHWSVYSLANGLQTLPETLESNLLAANVSISTNDKCEHINFNSNSVEIYLKSGKKIKANHVISSIPARELAKLIGDQHPHFKKMLAQQESATVAVVNLRYSGNVITKPAFGFLVPPSEDVAILGVIFDSLCFSNHAGDTVLTAMIGGHNFYPQFENASKQDFVDIAVKNIKQILGIKQEPNEHSVSILQNCIPQYNVGHYERNDEIFNYIKHHKLPIHLVGSSYNGISVNDVIMSASQAVSEVKCIV